MDLQISAGQRVTVNSFGGKKISRIVVEVRGDIVLICREDEYAQAREERRQPVCVGFKREDVLQVEA